MVDFTLNGERDASLRGEVQHFCNAHQRVADLAEDLAKLKRLYWNMRWDEYNSLRTLCHARTLRVHCKDFITIRSLRSLTIFRS